MAVGDHWLRRNNNTEETQFQGELYAPWPEDPAIKFDRAVTRHRMIPGWNGTTSTPGRNVVLDAGFHKWSGGRVTINIRHADQTLYDALFAKAQRLEPLLWSPDGGVNVYRVAWADGESFDPVPMEGFPGHWRITLTFFVLEKTV